MTFMAKGLMMILLLLAVSACGLAQSCIPLEIQPFDYTLDVHGTRYVGTAVVSPVPGEPVYELTAEGYTGVREDAERIYALLDHAGEAMEEKHQQGVHPFVHHWHKTRAFFACVLVLWGGSGEAGSVQPGGRVDIRAP